MERKWEKEEEEVAATAAAIEAEGNRRDQINRSIANLAYIRTTVFGTHLTLTRTLTLTLFISFNERNKLNETFDFRVLNFFRLYV